MTVNLRAAPEVVETPRLLLRRPQAADVEPIFTRYASDAEVTRYMTFPRHQSIADAQTFFDFSDMEWKLQKCGPYLVFLRASERLIGGTGLSVAGDEAETGYVFARDAWGLGYATEALIAMVEVGRLVGLRKLTAHCHPDHLASQRVLQKGGFRLEHRARDAHVFPNLSPLKQDVLSYVCDL